MNISPYGLSLIKEFEGLRLDSYDDGGGVWTIGYGHTKGVKRGQRITEREATDFLLQDLDWVQDAIEATVRVPLTQPQYDALCSLIFNIGAGAFAQSTLLKKLNAGDYAGAGEEFPKWKHDGGKVIPGLVKRREKERVLFLTSEPPVEVPTPPPDAAIYTEFEHTLPPETEWDRQNPVSPTSDIRNLSLQSNKEAPVAPILAALLPTIIDSIPKLGKIFGSGSAVSERNIRAAEIVAETVKAATGAVNEQEAVDRIKNDPEALRSATQAIDARWFELTETGGGGVDGARKGDAATQLSGNMFQSPSLWVAMALLPLVYLIVGNVVGLFGAPMHDEVRSAISNGVVGMVLGGLVGYYYGQSTSRNRPEVKP
jgi:lysozyme